MEENNPKKSLNKYVRLTGIGFQIGITMYLAGYLGEKTDAYFNNETEWFTLLFLIIALISIIYSLIKQLKKLN